MYVFSEHDNGLYDAMNKGLSHCKGKYVYFLNAGDVFLHDQVLSIVAKEIIKSIPKIFVGKGVRTSRVDGRLIYLEYDNQIFDAEFFQNQTINHQCLFAERALFESYLFQTEYSLLADYDWLIKNILTDGVEVEYRDVGVVQYLHEGLSNSNYAEYLKQKKEILEKYDIFPAVVDQQVPMPLWKTFVFGVLWRVRLVTVRIEYWLK